MSKLSPAAEAVLDAVHDVIPDTSFAEVRAVAAALRAAADQVVPTPEHLLEFGIRKQLLAIADELEGAQ